MQDPDTIALRPTVVDGVRQENDYEVIWRDLSIGRIMKPAGSQHWWWGCNVYGQPPTPNDRGPGIDFKDCQVRFKLAWARIRPTLTQEAIAIATQQAADLKRQQPVKEGQLATEETLQVLENKRGAARQRILRAGTIEFSGGTIDCIVRNISQTGAAIEVASPMGIPDEFNFRISGDHVSRRCQVAWRREKRIGVEFK